MTTKPLDYTLSKDHLHTWIESNKDRLQPPVCNALMHNQQLKTMIVGGPNVRRDFHTNPTDEWFYQLKGPMVLTIMDIDGSIQHIPILEGQHYLLPPNIPHSPQRFENSIGLVMETDRPDGMLDTLTYFCPQCNHINYTDSFQLTNLGQQLVPFISAYYMDIDLRTCQECNHIDEKPTIPVEIPSSAPVTEHGHVGKLTPIPVYMADWLKQSPNSTDQQYIGQNLHIHKYFNPNTINEDHHHHADDDKKQQQQQDNNILCDNAKGEKFVYSVEGVTTITMYNDGAYYGHETTTYDQDNYNIIVLQQGEFFLLPPCTQHTISTTKYAVSCTFDY